jgi:predicted nucleic acid-binding Zn ribbon protein
VRLDGSVLIVEPASRQWAQELARSRDLILARVQRLLGPDVVTSIVVRTEQHA